MESFATLCLGSRPDADTWEMGCASLGLSRGASIKTGKPKLEALSGFFRGKEHWLFLAGHFSGMRLYNEDDDVAVTFAADRVTCEVGRATATVEKSKGFALDATSRVILWGGCSVCSADVTIRSLRSLFGKHVLLGFAGLTGYKMVNAMLGDGFLQNHFFRRVKATGRSNADIVNAWMGAAAQGYGNGKDGVEQKFRAVDWDGQEWMLSGGKVAKGRNFG